MFIDTETGKNLVKQASEVRSKAYAPYSQYLVGAAVLDDKGQTHVGVNVENVAYGSTICAERSAILRMVSQGGQKLQALAVVTKDGGYPCGACLQVIREFADGSLPIFLSNESGDIENLTLAQLFPLGFDSALVTRTERLA